MGSGKQIRGQIILLSRRDIVICPNFFSIDPDRRGLRAFHYQADRCSIPFFRYIDLLRVQRFPFKHIFSGKGCSQCHIRIVSSFFPHIGSTGQEKRIRTRLCQPIRSNPRTGSIQLQSPITLQGNATPGIRRQLLGTSGIKSGG